MTASKVQLVFPVRPDPRVHLERTETREKLVNQDKREARQTRENKVLLVQPVSRVWSERQVQPVVMVRRDLEVSKACLARREMKAPEDSPVYLDPSDCRDYQALQVRRERMVTSAQWVHLVLQAPEAPRVPVEPMVHLDLQVV